MKQKPESTAEGELMVALRDFRAALHTVNAAMRNLARERGVRIGDYLKAKPDRAAFNKIFPDGKTRAAWFAMLEKFCSGDSSLDS